MKTTGNVIDFLYRPSLVIIGFLVFSFIVLLKSQTNYFDYQVDNYIFLYTIAITTFQISRLIGATIYRKIHNILKEGASLHSNGNNYEPSVSFVIPCKNEENAIGKTVDKCFEANYPKNKLEVIVINDGSTDRTIDILRAKQKKYPNLIVVDWKQNRGKRHGMAEGFRLAKGEIVVQLDSDSYIEPSTFRKIVEPFANPIIGAVCAHADPENADTNWLTKMQVAYYFMSFRILKAAESAFATVFCCSGCSSAYRKAIVLPVLDKWLNEKFLGLPVTWGDDRALTNWVLKQGYKTIYTDEAQAYTICPDTFRKFIKQQIRWKKGWFVNSLFASKFIIKIEPFVAFTYFFPLIIITLITPFMAFRALIYNPFFQVISPVFYITGVFLIAALMTVYYRYVARENKYWPYMFVWSGINMIFLSFILFYALATIQNRQWGTR